MNLKTLHNSLAQNLDTFIAPLLLLFIRLHVSWVFLKAGFLKIQNWDSTLYLFSEEYRVPLLPPELAAYLGTVSEIVLPVLLILGIFSRFTALSFIIFNIMIMFSYGHELFKDGFVFLSQGALDHQLWIVMLAVVVVFSGGKYSVDRFINIK